MNPNGSLFSNNKNNEAFLDRVYIVKVPYCLRVSEEIHIYDKLLDQQFPVAGALRAQHAGNAGPVQRIVTPGRA